MTTDTFICKHEGWSIRLDTSDGHFTAKKKATDKIPVTADNLQSIKENITRTNAFQKEELAAAKKRAAEEQARAAQRVTFTVNDLAAFKRSLSIAKELMTEVRFTIQDDELTFVSMDPANVAMWILKARITPTKKNTKAFIALNINDLTRALRELPDQVKFELNQDQLRLTTPNTTITLKKIDVEERETKKPTLKFSYETNTPSTDLARALKKHSLTGETLRFQTDAGALSINSHDADDAGLAITTTLTHNTSTTTGKNAASKFSCEYLQRIADKLAPTLDVEISLGTDYPLQLTWKNKEHESCFILAPRVDNE